MASFPIKLIVGIGKAIVQLVRETSRKGSGTLKHWYPKHWEPAHTCYYCGRFDQEERLDTDPPCPGKPRVML
jgi:hypothetical protein